MSGNGELFYKGIKVLSLFFIDEVAKYKQYDEAGHPYNGIYADMFEEEYRGYCRQFAAWRSVTRIILHVSGRDSRS